MRFLVKILNGKIEFWRRKNFDDYIKTLSGEYDIILEKHQDYRTIKQNKYYWAYLNIISEETGEDSNSLHELLKKKFLPPRYEVILGEEVELPPTTTKIKKGKEWEEYLDRICEYTGIPLPDPFH
jgi:hypothetical protein